MKTVLKYQEFCCHILQECLIHPYSICLPTTIGPLDLSVRAGCETDKFSTTCRHDSSKAAAGLPRNEHNCSHLHLSRYLQGWAQMGQKFTKNTVILNRNTNLSTTIDPLDIVMTYESCRVFGFTTNAYEST